MTIDDSANAPTGPATPAEIQTDSSALGYRRSPELQQKFEAAATSLLETDGWKNPGNDGQRELVADLALEGGGVKGIGLMGAVLVLHEAGYRFQRIAGTSAGAIAAALIAALSLPGQDMLKLKTILDDLDFTKFMPEGKLHAFMDHTGRAGAVLADAEILMRKPGIYNGNYLAEWLEPILADLKVRTFEDLKITLADDPGMSLPDGHNYRLVVHTSDVTRKVLARLPWDYDVYGHVTDHEKVVDAVRASMSIPFFFEPVTFVSHQTELEVPAPDGSTVRQQFAGGSVTWVDGGMLRNFPISAFDRVDGGAPRWPTIGIKLSSLATSFPADAACESAFSIALHAVKTMMNEWDMYSVDEATAARTIFVDNAGISTTDFDLTPKQKDVLFLNGVTAATNFVIAMANAGHVPRTRQQAQDLVLKRRASGVENPGTTPAPAGPDAPVPTTSTTTSAAPATVPTPA